MTTMNRAVRCNCGHRSCDDWHVSGSADVHGVKFSKGEAHAIADLLNAMEAGDVSYTANLQRYREMDEGTK